MTRAALLIGLVFATSAPADELDRFLEREMSEKLRDALSDGGFDGKVVGFLPFRSRVGDGDETFNGGTINSHFPEMLALSLLAFDADKGKPRFRILRDVTATASASGVGSWFRKTEERRKFFTTSFPVFFFDGKAKPDVLLTGLIRVGPDGKETLIRVESFTDQEKKPTKLVEASLPTAPSLLRAMGVSFELSPEDARKTRAEREALVMRQIQERGMKVKLPKLSPESVGGLKLDIFYDGKRQEIQTRRGERGDIEFHLATPKKGQKVTLTVTHLDQDKEPLGFVLRVNGENTWGQERLDAESCRRWLLKPGGSMTFAGFSSADREGTTREQPWKVLDDEESHDRVADFGDKTGLIDLDVFSSGGESEEIPVAMDRSVLRSPSDFASFRKVVSDFNEAKSRGVKNRGVIVRDENVTGKTFKTQEMAFTNPVPRAGVTVRYYNPADYQELVVPVTDK